MCVAAYASSGEIWFVISHVVHDDTEHLIASASGTLSPSKKNYSSVERERLSLWYLDYVNPSNAYIGENLVWSWIIYCS